MPTVAELKQMCRNKGIKGFSKMKKAELLKRCSSVKKLYVKKVAKKIVKKKVVKKVAKKIVKKKVVKKAAKNNYIVKNDTSLKAIQALLKKYNIEQHLDKQIYGMRGPPPTSMLSRSAKHITDIVKEVDDFMHPEITRYHKKKNEGTITTYYNVDGIKHSAHIYEIILDGTASTTGRSFTRPIIENNRAQQLTYKKDKILDPKKVRFGRPSPHKFYYTVNLKDGTFTYYDAGMEQEILNRIDTIGDISKVFRNKYDTERQSQKIFWLERGLSRLRNNEINNAREIFLNQLSRPRCY